MSGCKSEKRVNISMHVHFKPVSMTRQYRPLLINMPSSKPFIQPVAWFHCSTQCWLVTTAETEILPHCVLVECDMSEHQQQSLNWLCVTLCHAPVLCWTVLSLFIPVGRVKSSASVQKNYWDTLCMWVTFTTRWAKRTPILILVFFVGGPEQ